VYNGIDIEAHAVPRRDGDPPLILSVGRLIPKKGFADLISACAELHRRGIAFRCEIIGEGPLEDELRAQIVALELSSKVALAGPLPQSRVLERLSETRVFALACVTEPDGGRDNLPTVLMEAMGASVPCVSTRLAGIPEMVVDGITGILVDEHRPDAFADALEGLLGDRDRCRRMGAAGFERARREFAREVTAAQLIRLLMARGLTRIDPALVGRHPALAVDSARQLACRAARLARFRPLRHRRAPDFLDGSAPEPD
jgi:glycosyltransferase involved in cell wall biosynthesis